MAHPDTGCSCAGDRPTTARRGRQHRFGRTDPDFGHPHQIPSTSVSTNPISLFRVSGPRRCIISEICQKRLLFLELILKSVLFKKNSRQDELTLALKMEDEVTTRENVSLQVPKIDNDLFYRKDR
jgi:hypothetical protein